MSERRLPRRPRHFSPAALEAHGGTLPGPAEQSEVAHETARALVGHGRAVRDPAVTARLVALAEQIGLSTVADLWADRPARSLPGALWRLYALREWVGRHPHEASREYAAGMRFTAVAHVVAGIAEPPGPDEVRALTDAILTGVFEGDLAVALDRAAAFCHVVAAGRADLAGEADALGGVASARLTGRAAAMQSTARDLEACGRLWRRAELD